MHLVWEVDEWAEPVGWNAPGVPGDKQGACVGRVYLLVGKIYFYGLGGDNILNGHQATRELLDLFE